MNVQAKYLHQNHCLIILAIIFRLLLLFVFLSKIIYIYIHEYYAIRSRKNPEG